MQTQNEEFDELFSPEPEIESTITDSLGSDAHIKLAVQMLKQVRHSLTHVIQLFEEGDMASATRQMVNFVTAKKELESVFERETGGRVLEGVFDGMSMIGPDGTSYDVPQNYASKSHLVEGDMLKLNIKPDGGYVYKQIGPIERKRIVGKLSVDSYANQHIVICDKDVYKVLAASVTYHRGIIGDDVVVLVPAGGKSVWAAFESVSKREV